MQGDLCLCTSFASQSPAKPTLLKSESQLKLCFGSSLGGGRWLLGYLHTWGLTVCGFLAVLGALRLSQAAGSELPREPSSRRADHESITPARVTPSRFVLDT